MNKRLLNIVLSFMMIVLLNSSLLPEQTKFIEPALITSAGQSAEVQLANVLAKRAGISAALIKQAEIEDLEGIQTIILVVGVSLKGMGAAGLDMNQEKSRVNNLIEAAKKEGIPILCLHLGGKDRRGNLSDELIKACLPHASSVIVVKSGNMDGLFTSMCSEKDIPLIEVERAANALDPLKKVFGK
ncbi:DUF6305 family protein [Acidobacteriota bacterium]